MYLDDDDFPEVEFSTTNVILTLDSAQATENKVIMSDSSLGKGGFLAISPYGNYFSTGIMGDTFRSSFTFTAYVFASTFDKNEAGYGAVFYFLYSTLRLTTLMGTSGANTFTNNVVSSSSYNGIIHMDGAKGIYSIGNTFTDNTGVTFYQLDNDARSSTAYYISSTQDKVN